MEMKPLITSYTTPKEHQAQISIEGRKFDDIKLKLVAEFNFRKPYDIVFVNDQALAVTAEGKILIVSLKTRSVAKTIEASSECHGISIFNGNLICSSAKEGLLSINLDNDVLTKLGIGSNTNDSYVAVNDGKIYCTNTTCPSIQCYNVDKTLAWEFMDQSLQGLGGIAVDKTGVVYVGNQGGGNIIVISPMENYCLSHEPLDDVIKDARKSTAVEDTKERLQNLKKYYQALRRISGDLKDKEDRTDEYKGIIKMQVNASEIKMFIGTKEFELEVSARETEIDELTKDHSLAIRTIVFKENIKLSAFTFDCSSFGDISIEMKPSITSYRKTKEQQAQISIKGRMFDDICLILVNQLNFKEIDIYMDV
ncbi:unnamed protein product [Mytilus edulis]|uniref:Uncharacterized protein n=1 Tax=Mytilus edulis TaxID=6550 RepID=A0A8S3U9U3_MYTED|nr:unnamed protein product [Mytilus edulis]